MLQGAWPHVKPLPGRILGGPRGPGTPPRPQPGPLGGTRGTGRLAGAHLVRGVNIVQPRVAEHVVVIGLKMSLHKVIGSENSCGCRS